MVRVRTLTFLTAVALAIALAVAATWAVAPPGGPTEGVGVHGHWTIDVHDPDGSLAASHEFHNAFVGSSALTGVLSAENPATLVEGVPDWLVSVQASLCDQGVDGASTCWIGQDGSTYTKVNSHTLDVSRTIQELTLQGSFIPDFSGDITRVGTSLMTELSLNPVQFTDKQLDADPISVVAGQFVTVTVDISFSDAPA